MLMEDETVDWTNTRKMTSDDKFRTRKFDRDESLEFLSTASKLHASPNLCSGIYSGTVSHIRFRPTEHGFQYRLFMVLIDLDEVDKLFASRLFCSKSKWSPVQFRRSDYLGDSSQPLACCVREKVLQELGRPVAGSIRLLTHLRYFGFNFNPVSFYYCYSHDGQNVEAIVADVTNTPWGERHAYVIPCDDSGNVSNHLTKKEMHVSPFMPMEQVYRWNLTPPNTHLHCTIENLDNQGSVFSAHLSLHRKPFTSLGIAAQLLRFPWMTVQVVVAIYWQAFQLWLKGTPLVAHPKSKPDKNSVSSATEVEP